MTEETAALDAPEDLPRQDRAFARLPWAAAVAGLILLNSIALVRWTSRDTRPLAWDEAVHTKNTYEYKDRLASGSFIDALRPVYFNYPPLYNLSVIPFLNRVADVADAGAMANVFYLAGLVWLTYLIGANRLDRRAGLAAATLVGFYPLVNEIARATMLDLALTTWVAAAFWCLLKSEDFARPGWSAAFGAALALGMLTKWTAPAYLVGPVLPSVWVSVRRRTFGGLFLAAFVLVLVSSPWYAQNLVPMLTRVTKLKDLPPASGLIFTGWMKLLWYPIALFEQLNLPFLVLFVMGLAFSFSKRPLWRVLLWYFVSMLLFSAIRNNNVRYLLPALPAVAVLSASWVKGRTWALGVVEAVAFGFFIAFNFLAIAPKTVVAAGIPLTLYDGHPPIQENWRHAEIIKRISELRDPQADFSQVTVVSNAPYFHSTTLNISARGLGADRFAFRGTAKERWLDFAEFLLVKTGDLGPDFTIANEKRATAWLASPPAWFAKVYKEAGRWPLPDGSQAILYHADPDPVTVAKDEMMSVTLNQVNLPNLAISGVSVRATALSPADTAKGRLAKVMVTAKEVNYRGLVVNDVEIDLIRPQINAPRYKETGEIQILALDRLAVTATASAQTLLAYAAQKAPWLSNATLRFDDNVLAVAARLKNRINVKAEAAIHVDADLLQAHLESLSVGGMALPTVFVRALTDKPIPLNPNPEWPYRIDLGRIEGSGDTLKVGVR